MYGDECPNHDSEAKFFLLLLTLLFLLLAEEEQDLRWAIELSMRETSASGASFNQPSPFAGCIADSDMLAAAADLHSCSINMGSNVFGIIKDVKISNIVASDDDKTVQFESKNFKHMLGQLNVDPPLAECSASSVASSDGEQYSPASNGELLPVAGCSTDC
jgi:hypothetical protein